MDALAAAQQGALLEQLSRGYAVLRQTTVRILLNGCLKFLADACDETVHGMSANAPAVEPQIHGSAT